MKTVNIFSRGSLISGSGYGYYEYWLECGNTVRYGWDSEKGLISATAYTVLGLVEAVGRITRPCHVVIYTKGPIGFGNIRRSKNANELHKILRTLEEKGCTYEIEDNKDLAGAKEREMFRWNASVGMARPNKSDAFNKLSMKKAGINNAQGYY